MITSVLYIYVRCFQKIFYESVLVAREYITAFIEEDLSYSGNEYVIIELTPQEDGAVKAGIKHIPTLLLGKVTEVEAWFSIADKKTAS